MLCQRDDGTTVTSSGWLPRKLVDMHVIGCVCGGWLGEEGGTSPRPLLGKRASLVITYFIPRLYLNKKSGVCLALELFPTFVLNGNGQPKPSSIFIEFEV
jgi:hypothetical protein